MVTEIKRSVCYSCATVSCAVKVHIENGKVVNVTPDTDSPLNPGPYCLRLGEKALPEYMASSMRLNFPMKRVGERGEGKWERISWDQAFDEIAAKLKEIRNDYGAEALATHSGTGRYSQFWCETRFGNLYGTPNRTGASQVCYVPSALGDSITYGMFTMMYVSPQETKCMVYPGGNCPESTPVTWKYTLMSKEKYGTKVIVIDPRFTESARHADIWLPTRPGTDCALLLSWLHVIIEEELYDREFVEKWTNAPFLVRTDAHRLLTESDIHSEGNTSRLTIWDTSTKNVQTYDPGTREYASRSSKPALAGSYKVTLADGKTVESKTVWQLLKERCRNFTPEKTSKITWVPADKIREAARMYATNKPSCTYHGLALEQSPNSLYALQTKAILKAVTGVLDVKGGELMFGPNPKIADRTMYWLEANDKLPPEQRKKQLGSDRFRLIGLPGFHLLSPSMIRVWSTNYNPAILTGIAHQGIVFQAMATGKPYPVKACIVVDSNLLTAAPNTKVVYEGLKKLDLLVVLEPVMTPTGMLADYLLPVAHWPERPEINLGALAGITDAVQLGEAAMPKSVPGKYDRKEDYEIWRGIGIRLGQEWPWNNYEEFLNYVVERYGMTAKEYVNKKRVDIPPIKYRKYREKGFATLSGKVELWSWTLEKLDYDPLPQYIEPKESPVSTPVLSKKYPFILITGSRHQPFHHSEFRQVPSMRRMHPDPVCQINPENARKLGIGGGDWVWIETLRGRCKQKASVTTEVPTWLIHAEHGWWFPEEKGEEPNLFGVWKSNINLCTTADPEYCDPVIGSWPGRALLCRVYKCEE